MWRWSTLRRKRRASRKGPAEESTEKPADGSDVESIDSVGSTEEPVKEYSYTEVDYSRQDEKIRIILINTGKGFKVYAFDMDPVDFYL